MIISVSLAVEGLLDEQVLRQLLIQSSGERLQPAVCYVQVGRDRLRQNAPRYNQAARVQPFILLADLEQDECPPVLVRSWLPDGAHPNLLLRIAVRAVETGKNYNGQLTRFILNHWNAHRAAEHSPSLARAIRALQQFTPTAPLLEGRFQR